MYINGSRRRVCDGLLQHGRLHHGLHQVRRQVRAPHEAAAGRGLAVAEGVQGHAVLLDRCEEKIGARVSGRL